MSLQDLTNLSIPIHKDQDSKLSIPELKTLVCPTCQGHKEFISVLTQALVDVMSENKFLKVKEQELYFDLVSCLLEEEEINIKLKCLTNRL
jgi:hypothetical protein